MTTVSNLDDLHNVEPYVWIDTLPEYQATRVRLLMEHSESALEAAKIWLEASPENTYPFGGQKSENIFLEKIKDEFEKFLCGDKKYEEERSKLFSSGEALQTTIVSSISAAIAPTIGASSVYLMPIIVLLFITIGKISINAWCLYRLEERIKQKDKL